MTTRTLADLPYRASTIDVVCAGTQTTVQDYPGRVGYWDVGVPPSGPMDHLSFRLANRLVGNPPPRPRLEITVEGPALRFNTAAVVALTGARMAATLDGEPVPYWGPSRTTPGQTLTIGAAEGPGCVPTWRSVAGFDVPDYLGSKATFIARAVRGARRAGAAGRRRAATSRARARRAKGAATRAVPPGSPPPSTHEWEIGVLYGPHGAPDFFTEEDMRDLLRGDLEVHYNSARTGVRLIGPKPRWARRDGGEAGLHPSNIHDNAYAIGTIDFTGDMPIILGPDGPSLGGFVCPATIVQRRALEDGPAQAR